MAGLLTPERRYAVRRLGVHMYRAGARGIRFLPPPRVFVASQPKTGSHLLNALLSRLPKMVFSGVHYSPDDFVYMPTPHSIRLAGGRTETDWHSLRKALNRIPQGQFITAHWPAKERLYMLLEELGYRTLFIVRDPRDTLVSHIFFAKTSGATHLHHRYAAVLANDDERLMASIQGFPSDEHGRGQHPVGRRLAEYMPWLRAPNTYVCRFERLVGEAGGGSAEAQHEEIMAMARHVGRELSDNEVERLARRIWSPRSFTFRQGRLGDWRNYFTDEHKAAFKEQAGQYLIELGYETEHDW